MREYVVGARPVFFHCQNRETHCETMRLDRYGENE